MIKIRLSRCGKKKEPFYRIIVSNSKSPRDGKFIEKIGYFNPIKDNDIYINIDKFNFWKKNGACISKRVLSIFKKYY